MPTYEYACDGCGHEFEREQRISEAPVKECPRCGEPRARRQISQGNFILKGGGWYSDLYSGSGKKAKAGGEAKADSGGGEASTKADSGNKADSGGSSSSGSGDPKPSSSAKAA